MAEPKRPSGGLDTEAGRGRLPPQQVRTAVEALAPSGEIPGLSEARRRRAVEAAELEAEIPQVTFIPGTPPARTPVVTAPIFRPSERSIALQAELDDLLGARRKFMQESASQRNELQESYLQAMNAPLPQMGERPAMPDAPKLADWREGLQEVGPVFAIIAALGAMGTRQPAMNAMNALAAATEAYKKGAYEDFDLALKQWETESRVATSKLEQWRDERQAILDDRTRTVEQKLAALKAHDAGSKNISQILKHDAETLEGQLKAQLETDKLIQSSKVAYARIQSSAAVADTTAYNAFQRGETQGRRDVAKQNRERAIKIEEMARAGISSDVTTARAGVQLAQSTERLNLDKDRLQFQKNKLEAESRLAVTKEQKASIDLKMRELEYRQARLNSQLVTDEKELDVALKKVKLERDKVSLAYEKDASGRVPKSVKDDAIKLAKTWRDADAEAGKVFRMNDLVMNALESGNMFSRTVAQNYLTEILAGRTATNFQLQQVLGAGNLAERLEGALKRYIDGGLTQEAMDSYIDLFDQVRQSAAQARDRSKGQLEKQIINLYRGADPSFSQLPPQEQIDKVLLVRKIAIGE
jgi:hypothetical protein